MLVLDTDIISERRCCAEPASKFCDMVIASRVGVWLGRLARPAPPKVRRNLSMGTGRVGYQGARTGRTARVTDPK